MYRPAQALQPRFPKRALDRGGRLSRYVDFDKLETMIAGADEAHRPDHHRFAVANYAIALPHFLVWFDRSND